jgi:pimeloyl-ACP methyl ester carboxylesterase
MSGYLQIVLGTVINSKKKLTGLVFGLFMITVGAQTFNIGHTTKTFFDASRNRNIETEIYYPSDTTGDDVIIAEGNFPVIIFGHGFVMTWSAYESFWEELVPKGYIMCFPRTEGGLFPNHANFGNDLKYLAAAMQSENDISTSLFFNSVSLETALMGHSMGGGASFLGAVNNSNITTLVNFAAAETNPSAIEAALNVTVPSLVFSGDDDCVVPQDTNQNIMYDNLASACKTQVKIINGVHCYFADYNFNCAFGELTCNTSIDISRTEQLTITFNFLTLWLDHYLKSNFDAETDFNNLLQSSDQINYSQSCATLGAQKDNLSINIQVYPNPVSKIMKLKIADENLGGRLQIFNSIGKRVIDTKLNTREESQIDVSHLTDGFYIVQYDKHALSFTTKLIKIRS